ncbi:MAG: superoxide dismutase [Microgenomates group bacterium]
MYTLPELPYDYAALEPVIDADTMHLHHDKHHAAYVTNVNDALSGLAEFESMPIEELMHNLDKVPENVRTKVRNNGGGHYNHSLFWNLMSPTKTEPTGALLEAITTTFGSLEALQKAMSDAGLARFGSGWVWLTNKNGTLIVESTPNQDNPLMEGNRPILGIDVWEHAYYLKYKNVRAEYLTQWWNVVNWNYASELFGK